MREDFIEQLDKMFPEGYVIAYTCPDSQIRMSYWNPEKYSQLFNYYDCLKENFEYGKGNENEPRD